MVGAALQRASPELNVYFLRRKVPESPHQSLRNRHLPRPPRSRQSRRQTHFLRPRIPLQVPLSTTSFVLAFEGLICQALATLNQVNRPPKIQTQI